MKPPIAEKNTKYFFLHGQKIEDDYSWMRDANWPDVSDKKILAHLHKENEYFYNYLKDKKKLVSELTKQLEKKTTMFEKSLPVKRGEYLYFSQKKKKLDYPIYYRKNTRSKNVSVVLDINVIAKDKKCCFTGSVSVSPNHQYVAYSVDFQGFENYKTICTDIKSNNIISEIPNANNIVWHESIQGFFYAKKDENHQVKQIFFHYLDKNKKDVLVYETQVKEYTLSICKSGSRKFLFINSGDHQSNQVLYLDITKNALSAPELILHDKLKIKYYTEHNDKYFYVLLNDKGPNYRIARILIDAQGKNNTRSLESFIEYENTLCLEGFDISKNYILLNYISNGLPHLKVKCLNSNKERVINLDTNEESFEANLFCNNFDDDQICVMYGSLSSKRKYFQYYFSTNKCKVIKDENKICEINSQDYVIKRIFAKNNGTSIPITIFMKKNTKLDGSSKLLLYGYGAYGHAQYLGHSAMSNAFVDNGFIYAIAHIRGGGDLGEKWHEDGKLLYKKNTFEDFIECTKHLIKHKYTSKNQIVALGGSAGGMLIGNIINEKPQFYRGVIALVPFVDVLNTMLDESLPLTAGEFNEWGNPKIDKLGKYIYSYCPYINVKQQEYPHILAISALSDQRVGYWESAKWIAKLRQKNISSSKILFFTNMEGGHAGGSKIKKKLKEIAIYITFAISIFDQEQDIKNAA